MCAPRAILRTSVGLLALTLGVEVALMAAEPPSGLEFSGSDMESMRQTRPARETHFEFLDSGSSVSGVIQAPATVARPTPSNRARGLLSQGSLQDAGGWLEVEMENGRPAASAFERAAGVRDTNGAQPQSTDGFAATAPQPSSSEMARRPGTSRTSFGRSSSLELSGGLGESFSISGSSLDPIVGTVRPSSGALNLGRSGADPLPILQGVPDVSPSARRASALSNLGSERSSLFGLSQFDNSRSPRTVRELIGGDRGQDSRYRSELRMLDQDTTREELNPYVPRRREDFQFSRNSVGGDARLGIEGRPSTTAARGNEAGSLRALSSGGILGPSSLAPAVALPLNETPRATRSLGQSTQYQFPGRKF